MLSYNEKSCLHLKHVIEVKRRLSDILYRNFMDTLFLIQETCKALKEMHSIFLVLSGISCNLNFLSTA